MARIAFHEVSKYYRGASKPAVDHVSFEVAESSICMLLGTSGSGKTTLLRMVNRLIEPSSGTITIDGHSILEENPIQLRRRIGYVIQQVGLFPHMTIAENVRLTAEIAGWSKDRMERRVDELLTLVGLDPAEYRRRYPRQLSGGQQQRVGLARALASDPAILLMDEPFGALDAITRVHLQDELQRIQREMRKTILFVTHDVEEAFRLGDQIAILSEGRLVQIGSPVDLLLRPADEFVSRLIGSDNIQRQLQYLPVRSAMLAGTEAAGEDERQPRCSSEATLLEALMSLIASGAQALLVYDEQSQAPIGTITLSAINQAITTVRHTETAPTTVSPAH
ncbi:ABC transporter ATP-binding protein [Thermogemmatispora carboxidivorans]|uniref:ABC transporter ATP-binding protein n=1 Tax=Thermogemmatispora carboxidivorans TaxID=1382306 RepID=UPI00069A5629|nr:ABC transporter ATP-binding protein [Thermogemmatispora carboxidivorans]